MKNNRKNRKLKFITAKNKLRTGKNVFHYQEKLSGHIVDINEYDFENIIKASKSRLLKMYKLKLPKQEVIFSHDNDDFIKGLITCRVKLYLK